MQFIKRKVRSEKELFFDLIYVLDECKNEKKIDCLILIFFENGEEIIKNKKQKEAYKQITDFIANHKILKMYSDENLSCLEKAIGFIYMN